MMDTVITLIFAGLLTDNVVLSKLFLVSESQKKQTISSILIKSGILATLMVLSVACTYPIIKWVLTPLSIGFLAPLIALLIVCGIIFAAFLLSRAFVPTLYSTLGAEREFFVCFAAVLCLNLNVFGVEYIAGYLGAFLYAVVSALGFMLVSFIFFGLRTALSKTDIPEILCGLPITLLIASLLSMAFGGFSGI